MFIDWREQRTLLYNDEYAEVLAAKHPAAMGGNFMEDWSKIRTDLEPVVGQA